MVNIALRQFGISEHSSNLQNISCSNYSLCEVSVEHGGLVKNKRLPDTASNLADRIGVHSRCADNSESSVGCRPHNIKSSVLPKPNGHEQYVENRKPMRGLVVKPKRKVQLAHISCMVILPLQILPQK